MPTWIKDKKGSYFKWKIDERADVLGVIDRADLQPRCPTAINGIQPLETVQPHETHYVPFPQTQPWALFSPLPMPTLKWGAETRCEPERVAQYLAPAEDAVWGRQRVDLRRAVRRYTIAVDELMSGRRADGGFGKEVRKDALPR